MTQATSEKAVAVSRLMQMLSDDLESPTMADDKKVKVLTQLKVFGRELRDADAIYSDSGIEILCKYAFGKQPLLVSWEALRCIANALLLAPPLRAKLVSMHHATSLAEIYQRQDNDSEFLAARILFLLTYGTTADYQELFSSYGLAESIGDHLRRHAQSPKSASQTANQMEIMALTETSKLVFNLANSVPSETPLLSTIVPSLCSLLNAIEPPSRSLEGTAGVLINALAILDLDVNSTPAGLEGAQRQYDELASDLLRILTLACGNYEPTQLDSLAVPIVTVLRKIYDASSEATKTKMKERLLPNDSDRDLPLGQSSSLSSQLLRLTLTPGLMNLPEAISALLFEISDQDASKFITNIGYGHAAGYLMTHKIPIPEDRIQPQSATIGNNILVNPITGQKLDKEKEIDMPEMTMEEKEREAERLFVLFERLKATGIVDVKNPVEQAREEERLEASDDSKKGDN